MEYIAFTEEEKERAGAVNLVEFLTRQGEEMEPSGSCIEILFRFV